MNACVKWTSLSLIVSLALTACGKSNESKSSSGGTTEELTQYQRDSMLSTSTIPGARGVGAAMRAAGATSAGIRAGDSVAP